MKAMKTAARRTRSERLKTRFPDFEKNRAYFYAHKPQLIKQYRNKYIAIWNQQVVDADKDRLALLRRVRAAVGYKPVFVILATEHQRILRVPTYALLGRRKISA